MRDKTGDPSERNWTRSRDQRKSRMTRKGRRTRTAKVHGAGAITEVVAPTSRGYGCSRPRQIADFVIIQQQVI